MAGAEGVDAAVEDDDGALALAPGAEAPDVGDAVDAATAAAAALSAPLAAAVAATAAGAAAAALAATTGAEAETGEDEGSGEEAGAAAALAAGAAGVAKPEGADTDTPGVLAALAAAAAPAAVAPNAAAPGAAPSLLRSLMFFDNSAMRAESSLACRFLAMASSLTAAGLPLTAPFDSVSLSGLAAAGARSSILA